VIFNSFGKNTMKVIYFSAWTVGFAPAGPQMYDEYLRVS